MKTRLPLLAAACALALAACGNDTAPADTTTPAATPADTAPAGTAQDTGAGMPAATPKPSDSDANVPGTPASAPADNGKPAATVANCSTEIEGNDAMQFNVGSITVPSSCSEFTITLKHVGQMPVAAMGHNVVISKAADRAALGAASASAGVEGDYVPDGDARVLAHSELIGGGESTTFTFPVSVIQGDGPYEFFCSFPGHWAVMRGSIAVG